MCVGYFIDRKFDLTIYEAPKCGGTTLRVWINFVKNGSLALERKVTSEKYLIGGDGFSSSMRALGYKFNMFKESDTSSNICIVRDPVERFISCYNDKIIKENRWKAIPNMLSPLDIDTFLENLNNLSKLRKKKNIKSILKKITNLNSLIIQKDDLMKNYLWYHFAPISNQYGTKLDYFERIFTMDEINSELKVFLENKWKVVLPFIHTRDAKLSYTLKLPELSESQLQRITSFYSADYGNGWSK